MKNFSKTSHVTQKQKQLEHGRVWARFNRQDLADPVVTISRGYKTPTKLVKVSIFSSVSFETVSSRTRCSYDRKCSVTVIEYPPTRESVDVFPLSVHREHAYTGNKITLKRTRRAVFARALFPFTVSKKASVKSANKFSGFRGRG